MYITYSIHVTSYPIYLWHNIHYVWQHNTVLLIPQSAYVWQHLNYRWYHIHSITPNHSIYGFSCPSDMTSHPLYQTLHPLYLCHHNLSTDIIPNFVWHHIHSVWHHTHYICDSICTLYNIICTLYNSHIRLCVMTSQPLYKKPRQVCRDTYTLYMWHHSH